MYWLQSINASDILSIQHWSVLSIRHPARVTLHSVVAIFIRRLARCAEGSNEVIQTVSLPWFLKGINECDSNATVYK